MSKQISKKSTKATKPTKAPAKTAAKPASAKSAVKAAPAKSAVKAKPAAKAVVAKTPPPAKEKKVAVKAEVSRPALMTARGKAKTEEPAVETEVKASAMKAKAAPVKAAPAKDFEDNGEQLIAMAKDEMSKINKTGDSDKSGEKTSKFKPIKIERGNASDEKAKWQELNKRYGKEKAVVYKMSESFESLKPIQHKVLGWGFILTNDNNRLEVLFENGIKMLISNYKAN